MKASEKRLLIALLTMLLLGGVVIASDFYFDRRDLLVNERARLEEEWIVIETLFEEKELWEARAAWLEQTQPPFVSAEAIEQDIYQQALAKEAEGVTTSRQSLMPTITTPDYVQAGVSLTAAGELSDVFRWLYDLNRPDEFRVIRNLKVAPDKENAGDVVAQFELLRWYAPNRS